MKRPAFWILLALASLAAVAVGVRLFPQAFSILALDITMDRERALSDARRILERDQLGPPNYRQAASFALDDEAQTFVELEGGGKEAFTGMMRDGLYAAYTWRVRHFEDGETNETTIRFTPDGRPYGFEEKLKEDAPGAALACRCRSAARRGRCHVPVECSAQCLRARRAGAGTSNRRPHRSQFHVRTRVSHAQRGTLSRAARGLGRSPDGSHVLPENPGGVQPPLREHAVGERSDRHRVSRRDGAPLRLRRDRHRPVLHAPSGLGRCGGRRFSGASSSACSRRWPR